MRVLGRPKGVATSNSCSSLKAARTSDTGSKPAASGRTLVLHRVRGSRVVAEVHHDSLVLQVQQRSRNGYGGVQTSPPPLGACSRVDGWTCRRWLAAAPLTSNTAPCSVCRDARSASISGRSSPPSSASKSGSSGAAAARHAARRPRTAASCPPRLGGCGDERLAGLLMLNPGGDGKCGDGQLSDRRCSMATAV